MEEPAVLSITCPNALPNAPSLPKRLGDVKYMCTQATHTQHRTPSTQNPNTQTPNTQTPVRPTPKPERRYPKCQRSRSYVLTGIRLFNFGRINATSVVRKSLLQVLLVVCCR